MTTHSFHHGDRIRYESIGDDGYPIVRYGFVGGTAPESGPVLVMLDGEISGDVVDLGTIQPVHISTVTLRLEGSGLLDEPDLRRGLADLWHAEAEDAGLQITALHPVESGIAVRDSSEGFALAELNAAGEVYMLRATACTDADAVLISATRPNRWIF